MKKMTFIICFFLPSILFGQGSIQWEKFPLTISKELQAKVKFGYLTVPETHGISDGRTVKLAFTVFESAAKNKSDAILYLPGGPGQGYSTFVPQLFKNQTIQEMLKTRDVVLFDPRGCGLSEPKLCDPLNTLYMNYPTIFGKPYEEIESALKEAFQKCGDSLKANQVNIRAFSSASLAHDVEALRQELGYKYWNLRGHSYGSRYALSVLQQYSSSIRSAVISGIWPDKIFYEENFFDEITNAITLTLDECKNDPECQAAYPDLQTVFIDLLHRLAQQPHVVPLPSGSYPEEILLTPHTLLAALFQLQYSRGGIEVVPLMIDALAKNKPWILDNMAPALIEGYMMVRNDVSHIVRCNDDPYFNNFDPEKYESDPLRKAVRQYWAPFSVAYWGMGLYCDELGLNQDSLQNTAWQTDVPTLLFDGKFDPATPPGNTRQAAARFTKAGIFTVPNRGHDASAEVGDIIVSFLDNPMVVPDLSSIDRIGNVSFPTKVRLSKNLSSLLTGAVSGRYSLIIGLACLCSFCLFAFLYFPISHMITSIKKKPVKTPWQVRWSSWAVAAVGLAAIACLAFAVFDTYSNNPFLLAFGLSGGWEVLWLMPWLLFLAVLINGVLLKNHWTASNSLRIVISLNLMAALGLFAFFVNF